MLLFFYEESLHETQTILAEKRNASINSGVVFLKKIVDFI